MAMQFERATRSQAMPRRMAARPTRPHQGIRGILAGIGVQPKLKIGPARDAHEAEADRVANKVMRTPEMAGPGRTRLGSHELAQPAITPLSGRPPAQRLCADCEDEMQRKPAEDAVQRLSSGKPDRAAGVSSAAESSIRALKGGGQPLPASERAYFEPRFGRTFDAVRIHDSGRADTASRAIGARAFTLGNDIAFASGEYRPGTREGRRLLAHELTHTVQQGAPATVRRAPPKAGSGDFAVTYKGCGTSPYVLATIEKAAKDAYNKVKSTQCIADPAFRAQVLAEFKGLIINCDQNAKGPCGMASRYLSKTVNLYPDALKAGSCGPIESTILHEIIHLLEWNVFGHGDIADGCEKSCFNYGSGDASKCRPPAGPLKTVAPSRGNLLGGQYIDYAALAGIPLDHRGRFYALIGGYGTLLNNLASSKQLSFMAGALTGFRYQIGKSGPTRLNLDLQARAGALTTLAPSTGLPQSPAFTASGGLGLGLSHNLRFGGQDLQLNLDAGVQVGRIIGVPSLDRPYFNAGLNFMVRFGAGSNTGR